ncbi:hypothetical protein PEDI_48670 [Persicobacter diffluens]|uniref:Uncharacterized protein n=1 Tax=Persicobacter diffluens TaxID=981 RepID=A0AAN5ALT1_9BACT|nr:hypothetical protein PEDI_48670 [Persicobacter diffluens]
MTINLIALRLLAMIQPLKSLNLPLRKFEIKLKLKKDTFTDK